MDELMQENVVGKVGGQSHQLDIQADIPFRGTASPPCPLVPDGRFTESEAVTLRQLVKPGDYLPPGFDLITRDKRVAEGLLLLFVFPDSGQVFFKPKLFSADELNRRLHRGAPGDGHSDAPAGPDSDKDMAGAGAALEQDGTDTFNVNRLRNGHSIYIVPVLVGEDKEIAPVFV
jgi:hypothetical protein